MKKKLIGVFLFVREARLERLYTEITAPGSMASNELAGLANAAGSVNAGGSIV